MMAQPAELTANILANATPEVQKQILGERLYPLVFKEHPELAAKVSEFCDIYNNWFLKY